MMRLLFLGMAIALTSGCATIVTLATNQLASDLSSTILNSNDPDTVREGIPAYLILMDSLLRGNPDNEAMLVAAASLNGAFASVITDEQRRSLFTGKALLYAEKAICTHNATFCDLRKASFDRYGVLIATLKESDVSVFYTLGTNWVGWIQANSDDWSAIAELSRASLILEKLITLDETHDNGGAHLYLGGLETFLPASMGGKPEKGRAHFERSLELSGGHYLMTKVIYAERYARLVFDKKLHDRLLQEVIDADPVAAGMTLANTLAQRRAKELLAESDEYF
jgi:hypothetical protein